MPNRVGPINPDGRGYTRPRARVTPILGPTPSAQQSFNIGEAGQLAVRGLVAVGTGLVALAATRRPQVAISAATGSFLASGPVTGAGSPPAPTKRPRRKTTPGGR